jgi:DUF1680 family protein
VGVSAQPLDLAEVRPLDGPFKDAQERDKGYMLRVEPDRLMHWWRVDNNLISNAKPYIEYKTNGYGPKGHSERHFLSVCAGMYRDTGDGRFKVKLDLAVAIMAEIQATQIPGYLSVFPERWLRIMAGLEPRPENLGRISVPLYALHKVYQGLIDA